MAYQTKQIILQDYLNKKEIKEIKELNTNQIRTTLLNEFLSLIPVRPHRVPGWRRSIARKNASHRSQSLMDIP